MGKYAGDAKGRTMPDSASLLTIIYIGIQSDETRLLQMIYI